jgi:rod shape-determining protein MreD
MMQKIKPALILFIICSLLDGVITLIFPPDFTYQSLSLIPHLAFIVVLLVQIDSPLLDNVLTAALMGLITDVFFTDTFPIFTCFYPALSLIFSLGGMHLQNKWARFFAILALCFVLDFIPYTVSYFLSSTMPSINTWIYNMEFLTLCFNAPMIFGLDFIWEICLMYQQARLAKKARRKKLRS